MEQEFGVKVSWEVRWGMEEWEPEMHIVKELKALKTFFNNLSTTSKKLKFLFSFDSLKTLKLRAMGP